LFRFHCGAQCQFLGLNVVGASVGQIGECDRSASTTSDRFAGVGSVAEIDGALVVEVAVSDNVNVNLRDCFHDLQELDAVTLPAADPKRHQLCSEFIAAAAEGLGVVLDRDIVAGGGVDDDETIAVGIKDVDEVNPAVGFRRGRSALRGLDLCMLSRRLGCRCRTRRVTVYSPRSST